VIAALAIQPSGHQAALKGSGKVVAPALAKNINEVTSIAVARKAGTITLVRGTAGWGLKEKGGYPVDPGMVKALLVGLAELKTTEPKTNRPKLYDRLQVEDLAKKEAKSRLVTVTGAGGKTLAKLIIGKIKSAPGGVGKGSAYFRRPGEKRAWQAEGTLTFEDDVVKWLKKEIADIRKTRIRSFTVTHPDGKTVAVARDKLDGKMLLKTTPLPEKMVPKTDGTLGRLADTLEKLELEDVQPASKVDFKKNLVATTVMRTFDGLVVTIRVAKAGKDKYWVAFEPSVDTKDAIAPTDKAKKKAELKTAGDVAKEAKALKARLGGWAYKVSSRDLGYLRTRLKDLIQKDKTS